MNPSEQCLVAPTQRTWVSANSRRWWGKGKPGLLQSMGSQRVRLDLATEQQSASHLVSAWQIRLVKQSFSFTPPFSIAHGAPPAPHCLAHAWIASRTGYLDKAGPGQAGSGEQLGDTAGWPWPRPSDHAPPPTPRPKFSFLVLPCCIVRSIGSDILR